MIFLKIKFLAGTIFSLGLMAYFIHNKKRFNTFEFVLAILICIIATIMFIGQFIGV